MMMVMMTGQAAVYDTRKLSVWEFIDNFIIIKDYLYCLCSKFSNHFLCRFLDSLEISKMKSGVHSLFIALFLLVNRQGSKQGIGMVLLQ